MINFRVEGRSVLYDVNNKTYCAAVLLYNHPHTDDAARIDAAVPDLLALAERVANLNEKCPTIGAGMLATLTSEARAALAKARG